MTPSTAEIVVEHVRRFSIKPAMKADEARRLIRVYLGAMGMEQDNWGNFKDPQRPGERVHFSKQRVQIQRRSGSGWSNARSLVPADFARQLVVESAKTLGEEDMLRRFQAGRKSAAARVEKSREKAASQAVKSQAASLAFKALAADFRQDAIINLSGGVLPDARFKRMVEEQNRLTEEMLHLLESGRVPSDSSFASVDMPPVLPVFLEKRSGYRWTETSGRQRYTITVENTGGNTASIQIGSPPGGIGVDPTTHAMTQAMDREGDAYISGRVAWNKTAFGGALFMIVSGGTRWGGGIRVLGLWCRMMTGYGIPAYVSQGVQPEGAQFYDALEKRGRLRVARRGTNWVIECLGGPKGVTRIRHHQREGY